MANGYDWQLKKDGNPVKGRWRALPKPAMAGLTKPSGYRASQEAVDAVNVAINLGQPLLVTGEPGCGKTALADWVADQLDLGRALRFSTRSTAVANDLFYNFDAVGRFHAAQAGSGEDANPINFITYVGLGEAILRAMDEEERRRYLTPQRFQEDYQGEKRRSVVLIDEVDKAPRDFPNDLLGELETFAFSIPELRASNVSAEQALRPIVIITSNGERSLPDAFLRRCVYLRMEFPNKDLAHIVTSRIENLESDSTLVKQSINVVRALREQQARLTKPPSTSELLSFLLALPRKGYSAMSKLPKGGDWIDDAMLTLVKNDDDRPRGSLILKDLDPSVERSASS